MLVECVSTSYGCLSSGYITVNESGVGSCYFLISLATQSVRRVFVPRTKREDVGRRGGVSG